MALGSQGRAILMMENVVSRNILLIFFHFLKILLINKWRRCFESCEFLSGSVEKGTI